eukprot:TRINITY_DN126171_c0_g1_i1.p2 TRINITY_DN126171_c0_g1~~TRINITY_DN126171_c0_g1_i1.p2  ORF type:complete len:114 (+),score=31.80 TRINITY_DN126171_c0_g1_i1:66-407(+)
MASSSTAEPPAGAVDTVEEKQPSIWELIDEVVGLDRGSLLKALGVTFAILLLISGNLVWNELSEGRNDLAMIYGGFMLLVMGLIGSVAFVVIEADKMEAEKSGTCSTEDKKEQ